MEDVAASEFGREIGSRRRCHHPSYLRIVAGPRFAFVEAALAQLVYVAGFSYAFFFEGFTGLTVTIGAILSLFLVMQMTARVNWNANAEAAVE
jgi:hypothetical protein